MFQSRFDLRLKNRCASCGLGLADNDNGDGPAVFLIFILGFLLVPTAVLFDVLVGPPLWVHAVLWGAVALGITLLLLRPLKSYIMHLQYRHRPGSWKT
jgi:uncharacterized protein (DUF983 family)